MPLTLTAAVRETDSTCRAFAAVGLRLAEGGRGGRRFTEAVDAPKGAVVRFDPAAHATAFRECAQPRSVG